MTGSPGAAVLMFLGSVPPTFARSAPAAVRSLTLWRALRFSPRRDRAMGSAEGFYLKRKTSAVLRSGSSHLPLSFGRHLRPYSKQTYRSEGNARSYG